MAAAPIVLEGTHDQYLIANNAGSLYIQSTADNSVQTLPGVTQITFSDGTGIFDPTGTAEAVSRLYGAALNRAADPAGLQYWTSQIDTSHVPLAQVASAFAASPEFIQDYGTLTDAAFIAQLYQNVLNRPGDAAGTQYWTKALASGSTRGQVLNDFAQSPEYRADTLQTAGNVNDAEEYRLYQVALNREPDAAGKAYFDTVLANGGTPLQVAQSLVASPEFKALYGALSPADFIDQLYRNVFNAPGDAAGEAYWTNAVQQGASKASVVVAFADSIADKAQTAPYTHDNWVFIPAATA